MNRPDSLLNDNAWRILPHSFAYHLSGGRWKPFLYLVFLSHIIARAVAKGDGRILVSIPPRHGKSTFISQFVPAWFLTNWPDQMCLLSTYEANFAATWGKKTRTIIEKNSETLRVALDPRTTAASHWLTTEGGGMATAGVGGPITGKGGKLLLVDDPHKNWREAMSAQTRGMIIDWFNSTFYTRAEPGASIIVLHTRWHEEDLIGYLMSEHEDPWKVVNFPAVAEEEDILGRKEGEALCPDRYDTTALDRIKKAVGSMVWAGLYQQRPAAKEGNILKREWWSFYRAAPVFTMKVQSWDTGLKKDSPDAYSTCLTFGICPMGLYILDRWRGKVDFPDLERALKSQYLRHKPNIVLIEDKASGTPLIQTAKAETAIPVLAVTPISDKVVRAMAAAPLVEAGRVFLPELADWQADFVDNCANFPNIKNKDDVDAFSQGVDYCKKFFETGRIVSGMPRRTKQLFEGYR